MDNENIRKEVEFSILGKHYSVTYCEFYQPDTEFQSANDFMKHAKIGEDLLADLWDKAEDITIF
jgi:hypothetical protein